MKTLGEIESSPVANGDSACKCARSLPAADLAFSGSVRVVEARDAASLIEHIGAWEALVAAAAEPNVFYEPWMLLPALDSFGAGLRLRFLFMYATDSRQPQAPPVLCGFFPLECRFGFRRLPISVVSLWRYVHCFLCLPLIRAGFTAHCFSALLEWLTSSRDGGSILELPYLPGDGPTHEALSSWLDYRKISYIEDQNHARAFLRRGGEEGSTGLLSSSRRKKLQRQEKQLRLLGDLGVTALGPSDDIDAWIEGFLTLESAGWKGRQGTALACNERDRTFFERVAREAHRRGRLRMLAIHLDGHRFAHLCDFIADDGLFSFKIAYDEDFAEYSPGVLLDVENLRHFQNDPTLSWADSCNAPGPSSLMDLWPHRRQIRTLLVSSGNFSGNIIVAAAPWVRRLRRSIRSYFSPEMK